MTPARSDYLRKSWHNLIPAALPWAALVVPALLLFLPVLYYSLTTPFALVDDYGDWIFVGIFDSPERFFQWFHHQITDAYYTEYEYEYRHRPFWEFYNGVAWKAFGPTPWLHHLARWVVHFGAVFAFAAAFLCFARQRPATTVPSIAARFGYILPLALLVYLWLFFPNQPAARLSPQEVYTVFFLGLGSWMLALLLLREGSQNRLRATLLIYGVFYLSYLGLAWSKEINIAMLLWLLVSYYALLLIGALRRKDLGNQGSEGLVKGAGPVLKGISRWKLLGGLPLLAVFLHTLELANRIYQGGGYGTLTPGLIVDNAAWIAENLFQVNTSLFITAGLALLSALLLLFIVLKAVKGQFSNEVIFTLFLLGLFGSTYLMLCTSWQQVPRYWYILIPVFTTLLAFSARFALEYAGELGLLRRSLDSLTSTPRLLAASGVVGFIVFFVCCNYYNFLFQTVVQHHTRQAEARLIAEITRRHDQGDYIQVLRENPNELTHRLIIYYDSFLPRFYGGEYAIHPEPPAQAEPPWYVVSHTDDKLSQLRNYRPLSYARKVADRLQAGDPYRVRDRGVPLWEWYIYRSDLTRFWWNGVDVDLYQIIADAGEPALRDAFDVHLVDNVLIYTREQCNPEDVAARFFLAVYPVDANDLPDYRQEHGFDNLGFSFEQYGLLSGGKCLARVALPEYAIATIRTGQFVPVADGYHHFWEGEIRLWNGLDIDGMYQVIAEAGEPAIRAAFDVHLIENALIYTREQCSQEDLAARFFIHLRPVDINDLPDHRKRYGFDNLDFSFDQYGRLSGGKCLARIALPEYAVATIRTGQYVPVADGSNQLWEGEISLVE